MDAHHSDDTTKATAVAAGTGLTLLQQPLTAAEVRELWSFVHGDIMIGGIRDQLRRSLGLCRRHTWGYAVVEIELWAHGPGARGGHQPFDVCVLYSDLLAELAGHLTARRLPWHTDLRPVLRPSGSCRICDSLPTTGTLTPRPGYAGMDVLVLTEEANQLTWTSAWLRQTRPVWSARTCPACHEPGRTDPRETVAQTCREHLLAAPLVPGLAAAVGERLGDVAARMTCLASTMSDHGPTATAEQEASWIEALAWFARWDVPLGLVQDQAPT